MNRRNFLGTLVKAFTILPAATTYARKWITSGPLIIPASEFDVIAFQKQLREILEKRWPIANDIEWWTGSYTAERMRLAFKDYYDENGVLRPEEPRERKYVVIDGAAEFIDED